MSVTMPAGGVLSTATDLRRLASVAIGYERSPLAPAMAATFSTRRPSPGGEQALGWMVEGKGDDQFIVHDGGTFGFASSMVWDPKKRDRVVVLFQPRGSRRRRCASRAAPQPSPGEAHRHEAHRDRPRFGDPRQLRWPIYLGTQAFIITKEGDLPDDAAAS